MGATEILALMTGLIRTAGELGDIITEAQNAGREVTADELERARERSREADRLFETKLEQFKRRHGTPGGPPEP